MEKQHESRLSAYSPGREQSESGTAHIIEKQSRFFNAWGCFAESRVPGPPAMLRRRRDVSRETFLRNSRQRLNSCDG
jgi:hypothetical protein